MPRSLLAGVAAVLIGGFAAAAGAQPMPTDPECRSRMSARAGNTSRRSDKNSSFRAKRLEQECGPITDPQLHASCVASFNARCRQASIGRRLRNHHRRKPGHAEPSSGLCQQSRAPRRSVARNPACHVVYAGQTIADSTATLRVEETGHGPVHYIPEKDVRLDLLRPTATTRPIARSRATASYWTIEPPAGGEARRSENAVWAYRDAL